MRTAQEWLDEYGESHQNPVNKLIHWFCVPLIMFSTLGLFWSIPHAFFEGRLSGSLEPYLNFAGVVVLLALVFYLRLSLSLFLGMAIVSAAMLVGNHALDQALDMPLWKVSAGIFAVAWVFQFMGHKIEGKKPSFLKDLQFLLVGPAWLLGFVYRRVGIPY